MAVWEGSEAIFWLLKIIIKMEKNWRKNSSGEEESHWTWEPLGLLWWVQVEKGGHLQWGNRNWKYPLVSCEGKGISENQLLSALV